VAEATSNRKLWDRVLLRAAAGVGLLRASAAIGMLGSRGIWETDRGGTNMMLIQFPDRETEIKELAVLMSRFSGNCTFRDFVGFMRRG
jgi:hypothetical protein